MSELRTLTHRGSKLVYRVRGSGPPVVFIQGVNTQGDGWNRQVEALADRFTCLTFDNRGMGGSERGTEPLTVASMANDTLALLDAVGWASAHVVGHSLGGPIGLQLALDQTPRVRSLSLLCSFARGRGVGPLSWRLISAGMRMQFGTRRMKRRAFLELLMSPTAVYDPDALAEELKPLFGHDLAESPPVVKEQMRAMRAFDVTARLHELAGLPTLVASGEHDPIAPPRLGQLIAQGIPGAQFVELAKASHGVILTEPQTINTLLAEHITSAEPKLPVSAAVTP